MTPCMGRLRRAVASTLAATTCLLVSGCVSIPHSSPISQGRAVGVQGEPQHVTNDPPGPQPGASALVIAPARFGARVAGVAPDVEQTQQMAARAQLEQMRRALPPGAGPQGPMPGLPGQTDGDGDSRSNGMYL